MSEHEDEKYWFDDAITQAVNEIMKSGHFPEIHDFEVVALMAKGSHPKGREVASCSLVSEKIRVATHDEATFILTFWQNDWAAMTPIQRLETIIHELRHIDVNDRTGNPKLRPHSAGNPALPDFCTFGTHDKYSQQLALKIPIPTILKKAPVQVPLA
jgi:predicted metallopeptidase